jgi:hypothetical protein
MVGFEGMMQVVETEKIEEIEEIYDMVNGSWELTPNELRGIGKIRSEPRQAPRTASAATSTRRSVRTGCPSRNSSKGTTISTKIGLKEEGDDECQHMQIRRN